MAGIQFLIADIRHFHQCPDPGKCRSPHLFQSQLHDLAVLADQRYNIRHCTECHQLKILTIRFSLKRLPECLAKFKSHANTSQILIRIRAVRTMRIDNSQCRRQSLPRQMMISNNNIQFPLHGSNIGYRSNTTVHRNQKFRPLSRQFLQSRQIEAIPFLLTLRDIKVRLCAQRPQIMQQQ